MRNWKSWIWPGVAAVACLTALALWLEHRTIESDLQARAMAALDVEQQDWVRIVSDGRDLILRGQAPSENSRDRALTSVSEVYGVRVVSDQTRLLPLKTPYRFSAAKTENGVTLSGFAPDEATRARIVADLSRTLPGIAISDQIRLARGAPDDLAALAAYGMSAFPRFSVGELEIVDATMRVRGQALTPEDHGAALAVLDEALPDGATLESVDIAAAPIGEGYRFTAEIDGSQLRLGGYVPDPDARSKIVASVNAVRADLTVVDAMLYAQGAPDGIDWAAASAETVALVSRMERGSGEIVGRRLDLSGQVSDGTAFREVQTALGGPLPSGLVLGTADIGIVRASPFTWSARVSPSGVVVDGFVPDDATRKRLLQAAGLKFGTQAINDRQRVATGAPGGFEQAALAALQALSRLEDASVELVDGALSVDGQALGPSAPASITERLAASLPEGFRSEQKIDVKSLPDDTLDQSRCQAELTRLAAANTVLFETGNAEIEYHSHGFLDRIAFAARQCGNARLEISGHTDADGADDFNLALSEQRAEAVLGYMRAAGVDPQRMVAVGYGENRPVADNETEAGKAQNRRIEFRVVE